MGAAPRVVIVTSLAPHRLDAQRRALGSWRRLGFDVISVNSAAEVSVLQAQFPDVQFELAPRDASSVFGRPYVFVYDLVRAAISSGAPTCGIVNADIEFVPSEGLRAQLSTHASGALVLGKRLDYTALRRAEDAVYELGYDYFFFDAAIAAAIPDEPFCLGAPWWDYWLPAACLERGVPLRRVTAPIALHERHQTAFSDRMWMTCAGLMFETLERFNARPVVLPQSSNAMRDVFERMITLARKFREHIDRAATPVVDH